MDPVNPYEVALPNATEVAIFCGNTLDEYIELRDGASVISHASLTGKRKASS